MVERQVAKASKSVGSSNEVNPLNLITEGVLDKGINLLEITEVFNEYRKVQDAMKVVKAKLEALKPVLTEMVQNEGGSYTQDGYVGQIVAVPASRVLKTKAEVLVAVPKKYHYQILKDKKDSNHLKVAVAPKPNTVEVEITEQE